ncbi:amidohydrolase [Mycobacterium marinum]|uniref:amidohydrolase n=1 Tax=Mycobacterium marinum TaxID=1781 RepID=UPI000B968704|nr:amidohydrolase [Mycobacterium marinum]MDC8981285.1 amidohydrolase [Mycobacterium marinum]MDC8999874.1 amidohydrolase [Mycobacterium marinum]MDC9010605.1 amidohydrolase [Mycobacterium marinum]MDC9013954.1 amidohydrolase [Mycobacterium marinum]
MTGDADAIYTNGDIVTVDDEQPTAEAVAVKDGRIVAVGAHDDVVREHLGPHTRRVDLAGNTLLPGFIDPHSHYINALTVANQVNVFAPPAGPAADVEAIVAELKKFRDARDIADGEIIMAYGYDETVMPDGRTLHREDLDADFPNNPVLVGHVSLHGAVLNSAAMQKFGISADTETPPGGVIVRKEGSTEPDGLIMETAFLPIFASLPKPTPEQEVQWSIAGQLLYAAVGITTAHEGLTHAADVALLRRAAAGGADLIDVIAYPFILELDEVLPENPADTFGTYHNRLKLGGVKITLDGSPQGRTAFFTTPYLADGPGGEKNWSGELPFSQETVNGWFKRVYDLGLPLNIHANGDGAIDVLLAAHEYAAADDPTKDRHTTVIHSQFVRRDQLAKYVEYNLIPSLFTEHAFYFGDTHVRLRGKEQAHFLSPMRAAIDMGLRPTNHTDFNVTPLDQMFVLWTAVNRVSRGGEVIGADQRVTALEALKAITINAAYQYSEEQSKGSITVGKLADLVIVDNNPLTVDPMKLKDIAVLETIKEGRTIYREPATQSS